MITVFAKKIFHSVDWLFFGSLIFIALAGILTMNSFLPASAGDENGFFEKQIIWLLLAVAVLLTASSTNWRFLRRTGSIVTVFIISCLLLLFLFIAGSIFKGAQSWFDFGVFAFQPVDFVKLSIILLLSKYFGRRHIEIANVRHILISGLYTLLVFVLVFLQPDFGSAIIVFMIWLGLVLVSGISKKHLLIVFITMILVFGGLWTFVFQDYQRARIVSFIHPLTDLTGAGYSAYQSTIAVGSGQVIGKGVGLGSQSKLQFLPEYETDFIFAAFAEEWGLVGVFILFGLYGVVFWKIVDISKKGATNFEVLYGLGLGFFFLSHFAIHVGMNIGLLPITGITMPFMSYGGSHLVAEFLGIGILMGQRNYGRTIHREEAKNEMVGVV